MKPEDLLAMLGEAFPIHVVFPVLLFLGGMYFLHDYAYDIYREYQQPIHQAAETIREQVIVPWSDSALLKAHDDSVTEVIYSIEADNNRVTRE